MSKYFMFKVAESIDIFTTYVQLQRGFSGELLSRAIEANFCKKMPRMTVTVQ